MDIEKKKMAGNRVCLLPSYTCDTVLLPFEKRGWRLFFYPVQRDLSVESEKFNSLLKKLQPAVLLMHTYYGVDTIERQRQDIQEWRRKQGLIFIEDMTQSLALLEKRQGEADYYLGSLRKWLPIPDGAFLAAEHLLFPEPEREKENFVKEKLEAQQMKYAYLQGNKEIEKKTILEINKRAENYLYQDTRISKISDFSREQMDSINLLQLFQKRKKNSKFLQEKINRLETIKGVLDNRDSCPIYFPIYTENRERLQRHLREDGIFAPVLWQVPEMVRAGLERDTSYIFNHLLALPCDQRYGREEMERIYFSLKGYEEK
ncbi:MAG: hypothetical protein ACOCM8_06230 [Acetivibrio ethanolgignens]